MTSLDEAFGWLSYADDNLRDARDNLAMGKYGVAVGLAYYACFYAAKSVIAFMRERDPKTHAGVIGRFGELAVVRSDFPPEVARVLSYLAGQRGKTDYDLGFRTKWQSQNTPPMLEMSESFVAEVHGWFDRHVTQPPPAE